jgi:hypothetical protein
MEDLHSRFARDNQTQFDLHSKRKKQKGEYDNLEASYMNTLMCGLENRILMCMWRSLNKSNDHAVLCFDGIMIPKTQDKPDLAALEGDIKSKLNIGMQLAIKEPANVIDINKFKIDRKTQARSLLDSIEFNEFKDYQKILEYHKETKNIVPYRLVTKYFNSVVKCAINGGNTVFMTKNIRHEDGQIITRMENISLKAIMASLKKACPVEDPHFIPSAKQLDMGICTGEFKTIRDSFDSALEYEDVFHSDYVDFKPYLHTPPESVILNLFTGFPLARCYDAQLSSSLKNNFEQSDMYKLITNDICAGDAEIYTYVLSWIAHLIQFPSKRPGTNLMLWSKQGAGKGLFTQFIGRLISSQYYLVCNDLESFVGKFNVNQQGKLLIVLDEIGDNIKGGQKIHNILKNKTTEPLITIEPKGLMAYSIKNYSRYIFTTNNKNNLRIEASDRRYVMLAVNNDHANEQGYFTNMFEMLDDGKQMADAFQYFATYDISKYSPSKIPDTQYKTEQKVASIQAVDFLRAYANGDIYNGKDDDSDTTSKIIKTMAMYKSYVEYCNVTNEHMKSKKYFMEDMAANP